MSDSFEDRDAFASATDTSTEISTNDAPAAPNGFEVLGLAPELIAAVADLGYVEPTQVQNLVIPKAVQVTGESGRYADLMVSSQTGSGKTAAFLLPVLHTLLQQQAERAAKERAERERLAAEAAARGEAPPKAPKRKDPTNPRHFKAATPGALILCPTRELAQQVAHDAIDLVRHCRGLRIANVVGGMPYQMQVAKLQNANLVVATPGRLLDLQRAGQLKLDKVMFLVMDEADRMLDLGFADDLAEINQLTQQRHQTMMFSATFAPRIQQLALRVMHDNGANVKRVQIDTPQEKHANITQSLYWADNPEHKRKLLDHWLRDTSINQAIVFASTQIECDDLANDLQQASFSAVALHGALSQAVRNRRLMALRDGRVQILVATDVAARGIDVPTITHVFNFGLPMKAEDYTHRIGRTGRAGRDGLAITFAEFRDRRKIGDIEHHTQQPLKAQVIEGLEPKQRAPQTSFGGGGRGGFDRDQGRGGRGRPGSHREGGPSSHRGFGSFGRADKGAFARPDRAPERGFDRGQDRGFDRPARPDVRPDAREARAPWAQEQRPQGGRFADRGSERPFADRGDRGDRFGAPRQDREAPSFRGHDRNADAQPRGGFGGDQRGGSFDRGFDRDGHRGAGARGEHRPEHRPEGRSFAPRGDFGGRRPSPERAGFEAPRRRMPSR
jgi:superfamily II DNA/RNA helicase